LDVHADKLHLEAEFVAGIGHSSYEIAQSIPADLGAAAVVAWDTRAEPEPETPAFLKAEGQTKAPSEIDLDTEVDLETRADGSHLAHLPILKPVPTLRYYMTWHLPSARDLPEAREPSSMEALGRARAARDHLLRDKSEASKAPFEKEAAVIFLEDIMSYLDDHVPQVGKKDKIELGLAVYDPSEGRLRFVEGHFFDSDWLTERFDVGVDVIGHAFKTKECLFWPVGNGKDIKEQIYVGSDQKRRHSAVAAIPLLCPFEHAGKFVAWRYVVGVVALRAFHNSSRLLKLRNHDLRESKSLSQ
jgi:hypothetical protein